MSDICFCHLTCCRQREPVTMGEGRMQTSNKYGKSAEVLDSQNSFFCCCISCSCHSEYIAGHWKPSFLGYCSPFVLFPNECFIAGCQSAAHFQSPFHACLQKGNSSLAALHETAGLTLPWFCVLIDASCEWSVLYISLQFCFCNPCS